jgi:hypothetical protein
MASGTDVAEGVTVPSTRPPADAMNGQMSGARGPDVEHALVRDNTGAHGGGRRHGPPHRPSATDAGPPSDTQPGDAIGFREDA